MGNGESLWKKIRTRFQRRPEVRVLMVGLNDAGKTTILYKLKGGDSVVTIPTVGFNVETITYRGIRFTTWDVSGKSRSVWRYYYPNMDVLILVVDSNDWERIGECRDELNRLMCEDELKDCCLLIMANKQDLPNAMTLQEITNNLDLNRLPQTRSWYLQDCCATSGEGLFEGLGWVKSQLSGTKQVKMSAIQQDEEEPLKKRNRRQPSWLSFSNYLTHSNSANGTEACQLL